MRLLTFSFLKNCKYKAACFGGRRSLSGGNMQPDVVIPRTAGDPNLVQISSSWQVNVEPGLRSAVLRDMQVFPEFLSESEEAAMLGELEPQLKRMRYEFDHWDNAIHGFRETERSQWSDSSDAVIARVKALAFAPGTGAGTPLPHAHVLDLAGAGYIKPHVDAVRFCGEVIAGLCLVSSAVMRLQHTEHKDLVVDALLARRALYVMRGTARYQYTHEVLHSDSSQFNGNKVPRARRVAVIVRSQPEPDKASDHTDPSLHTMT